MPFFPVDDQAAHHDKMRRAGNAAVGLWARAGSDCMLNATDGVVERHALAALGTVGQAKTLVEVGLWHAHGHDCPRCPQPPARGWVFHDWTDWGPLKTAEQIKGRRQADRDRQRERRSRQVSQRDNPRDTARTSDVSHASPVPSPPPEVVDVSSRLTLVNATGIDDDGLDRIAHVTGGGRDHATRVAARVLEKTTGDVRDPLRYVMAAVTGKERETHRFTPRRTRDTECPSHPGQLATHCGGCRADRLAGGA